MNIFDKLNFVLAVLVHFRAYYVATIPTTCGIFQFQCDDGQCIKNYRLCDGENDCTDESDEQNCTVVNGYYYPCTKRYFRCVDTERCISYVRSLCNGILDCEDGSDELNCPVSVCNKRLEFECLWSKQCISLSKRCDGKKDCEDGSDERNCGRQRWNWSVSQFPCQDFISVPREWHCDGENDCGDNADEKNCEGKEKSCPDNYCMQNASCMFFSNQYYCNCPASFKGNKCEKRISDEQDHHDLGMIIGITVLLILLFITIVVMLYCHYMRRPSRNSTISMYEKSKGCHFVH